MEVTTQKRIALGGINFLGCHTQKSGTGILWKKIALLKTGAAKDACRICCLEWSESAG